jgi:hypothetical protein
MYCPPHCCCCDRRNYCQPPGSGLGVVLAIAAISAALMVLEAESPKATSPPTAQNAAINNPR